MIFFGVFLGLIILAAMIFLALSKRSKFSTRIASLIALAVMIITVIICICLVLFGGNEPDDEVIAFLSGTTVEAPKNHANTIILILLILFLVGLFVTVIVMSHKEHRKVISVKKNKIDDLFLDES